MPSNFTRTGAPALRIGAGEGLRRLQAPERARPTSVSSIPENINAADRTTGMTSSPLPLDRVRNCQQWGTSLLNLGITEQLEIAGSRQIRCRSGWCDSLQAQPRL